MVVRYRSYTCKPPFQIYRNPAEAQPVGNVIEGLLGAILEDSEYDVETCRAIYTEHILPHLDKYCVGPHEESQNPKDRLVKIMSMRKCRHFEIRRDDLNAKSGEYESTSKSGRQA